MGGRFRSSVRVAEFVIPGCAEGAGPESILSPLTVGDRDPIGKTGRRALQEIADHHPAYTALTRHPAGHR